MLIVAIVLSEGTVLIIAVHTFGTYSVSYSNYSSVVRRYSVNGNSTLKKNTVLIVTVKSEGIMSNITLQSKGTVLIATAQSEGTNLTVRSEATVLKTA